MDMCICNLQVFKWHRRGFKKKVNLALSLLLTYTLLSVNCLDAIQ